MVLPMIGLVAGVGAIVALMYFASLALEREVERLKSESRPMVLEGTTQDVSTH